MPTPQKARWDDARAKRLLLCIIKLTSPTNVDWNQIAAMMADGATAGALQKQFSRLRQHQYGLARGEDGGDAKPPLKRAGGEKRKIMDAAAGDDEGNLSPAPKKKQKAKAKLKVMTKTETMSGNEADEDEEVSDYLI